MRSVLIVILEKAIAILKIKKILIPVVFIFLLFLLTPISLYQIHKKIEGFIVSKSQIFVKDLQKQIDLKIHWEKLNFKLLNMSIHLENVTLSNANTHAFKKTKLLNFLNKNQTIKHISIHPSLFSLIFKKNLILSKVQIDNGDLNFQTNNDIIKTSKINNIDFDFPIKKIIIKNTNLTLTHKNHTLKLIGINWTIYKKISQSYYFTNSIKEAYLNQEKAFAFKSRGTLEKNRIYTEQIKINNDTLNMRIDLLELLFDSKGLKNLRTESSGKTSFAFVNQMLKIFEKEPIEINSLISYNLDLQFNRKKGYKAKFNFKGSDSLFKNKTYKSFSIEGRLLNKTGLIDRGFIKKDTNSSATFNASNFLFDTFPIKYNLSLQITNLNLSFILNDIINIKLPLKADTSGTLQCSGVIDHSSANCKIKNRSRKIQITNLEQKIVSFYNMDTDITIDWKNKNLNFEVFAKKKEVPLLKIAGTYNSSLDLLKINSDGALLLGKDIEFNTDLNLKGLVTLNNSSFKIVKNTFTASGHIHSDALTIENYKFKNIISRFNFKNNKLIFNNLKSNLGKSNYKGYHVIDFNKKESIVKLDFSFLDTQDIKKFLEPNMKWPLEIKGTGTASLFVTKPWNPKQKLSFTLSGNLFNTYIQKELFQRISFDISSEKGHGLVNNLHFKKGSGQITTSGNFNTNFDLNTQAKNIPIESLNFLTSLLPFKQSGLLTFNMKISGPLKNPQAIGSFGISDAFLYTFPVKNTKAKIKINKKGFTLSGNILNELFIEKFYYPFSKQKPIQIKGSFYNFDLIKILIAKNQKEFIENYYSKLKGNINVLINKTNQRTLKGVLNIEQMLIAKGKKWLKNKKPFSISFSKKAWLLNSVSFSQQNQKNLSIQKKNNKLKILGDGSLSFLSILFPNLKNLDGDINFNLTTNANLKNWNPQGTLKIQNGNISITSLPDLSNINASIQIDNTKIKISKLKTSIGLGYGSGGGQIIYNFTDPPNINFFLNLSDVRLNLPKDFLTEGNGTVTIKGDRYPYLLSGNYLINSGNITKNFSKSNSDIEDYYTLIKPKKSKELSLFQFQFKIKTTQPIFINNSIFNSSIEGGVTLLGSLNSPLLTGSFYIPKTKEDNLIVFRDQEFKIISGSVRFKNSSPDNPFINIKSETLFKEKSIDTLKNNQETITEYKILLTVNGLANNLDFSLDSSPSVDEKELISMLTLGVGSKYFDEHVKENITDYSYHLLGSLLLKQSLNKELKNKLGLDFNISPQINVLNEPVTKIALKKVWFDKLKTSFSRTIEEFPESDIRFKYDLKSNISITAFWENTEHIETDSTEKQKMGVDFEFAFDF